MAMAPMTKSVAYQRPRRSPNAADCVLAKDITYASYGLDQLRVERLVDFVPQSTHKHINDVRLGIKAVGPDMGKNHRFRHDFSGVAHQVFEQGKFTGPKIERDG